MGNVSRGQPGVSLTARRGPGVAAAALELQSSGRLWGALIVFPRVHLTPVPRWFGLCLELQTSKGLGNVGVQTTVHCDSGSRNRCLLAQNVPHGKLFGLQSTLSKGLFIMKNKN